MNQNKSATVRIGGLSSTILVVAFFAAKVTGHIDWSWWWVFAPYWLPLAIILFIGFVCFAVALIPYLLHGGKYRK